MPRSSGSMTEGSFGFVIDLFDRDVRLLGDLFARLELRRGLDHLAIELPELHRDFAVRCFDTDKFPGQLAPLSRMAANTEGAGFAKKHFGEFVRLGLSA